MRDDIADIDWELTGSELIALLKESSEIKANKPVYLWIQNGGVILKQSITGLNAGPDSSGVSLASLILMDT